MRCAQQIVLSPLRATTYKLMPSSCKMECASVTTSEPSVRQTASPSGCPLQRTCKGGRGSGARRRTKGDGRKEMMRMAKRQVEQMWALRDEPHRWPKERPNIYNAEQAMCCQG